MWKINGWAKTAEWVAAREQPQVRLPERNTNIASEANQQPVPNHKYNNRPAFPETFHLLSRWMLKGL
jgi:hypothetical protein